MTSYPEALNAILGNWFKVDASTRAEKVRRIRSLVTSKRKMTGILRDLYVFGRRLI
jgi:hypothetical protein